MRRRSRAVALVAGATVSWLALAAGAARAQPAPPAPSCPGNTLVQSFPMVGPPQTTWRICWREVAGNNSLADPNGLVIGPVHFRRGPNEPERLVLWDLRVSDYFVPYHPGSPRYYDLSGFNFKLTGVSVADCPPEAGGAVVSPRVCREIRDRGLMWKDFSGVRRGEEVVLWGSINAANYRYIQEYAFRDDGTVVARSGATAQNLPGAEFVPHTHTTIWRIDIDFGSVGARNSATRLRHAEDVSNPAGAAVDSALPIPTARGFTWSPRLHDGVAVSNQAVRNARNRLSEYRLIPLVTGGGAARHREEFTRNEFWVTPYVPGQFAARNLPSYIAGNPPVANRDLVLWYKGTIHHHPRDEDGAYDRNRVWVGTAHVMWTGFMLHPHGVFDCSPFYKPCP
jgi:primary-amine oxidase